MASPGAYYGPPPPRRSVVGPLILITVGVLFLLRNFGYRFRYFTALCSTGRCCWWGLDWCGWRSISQPAEPRIPCPGWAAARCFCWWR